MGNAAGIGIPPASIRVVSQASSVAIVQAKHAALFAHLRAAQVIRFARHYYAVVDERLLSRVQRVVEQKVLRRINRFMDDVEVRSKIIFVKHISARSIAQAYDIVVPDVRQIQISRRLYEVYNCGPELLNVPTLNTVSRVLELRDPQVIEFLLSKCVWAPWHPPTSWRMKTDQTYDLVVTMAVRSEGFLTGELRLIKLRVGKKWVGPHHHDAMQHSKKTQWLHRTDYEISERILTAESVFFQAIKAAWQGFLDELARQPEDDLGSSGDDGHGFLYEKHEKHPSLRVKYLVETSIESVMKEHRTMFRKVNQYEQWRMEQEDKAEHQTSNEQHFGGPLAHEHIDVLAEYYEGQTMTAEDIKIYI